MPGEKILAFPSQLTVEKVEEIQEQLKKYLREQKSEVRCSGQDVYSIDAAGLQLLLSFYKSTMKEGKKFVILNPSAELREMFSYSGVDKVFAVEEVE